MNFDVNYIVKEDEGVIVCIISECDYNAVALVNKYTGLFDDVTSLISLPDEFLLSNQYKGIAKCDVNDAFDEEYGKKLAYKKAYFKYATAFEKKVKYIIANYMKTIDNTVKGFEKALNKITGKAATVKLYEKANK